MLWIIFAVLPILWLAGSILHFGVGLMNILVISAVIVLLYKLITDTLQPDH